MECRDFLKNLNNAMPTDINLNIVECRDSKLLKVDIFVNNINLNIVECREARPSGASV